MTQKPDPEGLAAALVETERWGPDADHWSIVQHAIDAYLAALAPPVEAEPAKLDGNEIYEWLYGDLRGNVPDVLTEDVLNRLAAHIREHFVREAPAKLVEEMAEREAPGRTKLMLTIAARAIRRGRHLTPAEKLANLSSWVHGDDTEAPTAALASPTPPDDVAEGMETLEEIWSVLMSEDLSADEQIEGIMSHTATALRKPLTLKSGSGQ